MGIGASLTIWVVFVPSLTVAVTFITPEVIFARVIPINVVWVLLATTAPTSTGDVPTALSVLFLNVFAIIYPNAIAIATPVPAESNPVPAASQVIPPVLPERAVKT